MDYTEVNVSFVFLPDSLTSRRMCKSLNIAFDFEVEQTEEFSVTLVKPDLDDAVFISEGRSTAVVSITDSTGT